jgi:hypothetical protein
LCPSPKLVRTIGTSPVILDKEQNTMKQMKRFPETEQFHPDHVTG